MNIEELEQAIRELTGSFNAETFIYDLLLAYDLPKASITRLKKGTANLGKSDCDVLWKNRVCFSHDTSSDLHELVEQLKSSSRVKSAKPRFVIVTDGDSLLAFDMKNDDSLETPLDDLAKHFDFFLPWAGMEKSQLKRESVADIRAAEKMGRLYDLILESNPPTTDADRHSLNVFLARLLFCFFAEDTRIFVAGQFSNSIGSHTASDGGDLQPYLTRLFKVLAVKDRTGLPKYLADFPYVNGGLFCDEHPVPRFDAQSRKLILDCGSLNWRDINPDIFGSMIQAVVHSEERGNLGIHYTSVLNIMKVIEPLFLNDLRDELEKAGSNRKKLEALLERLYRIRVFDPACGSGNFLIIAYKELSKLEIEVFKRLHGDQRSFQFESKIQLTQFYGIEIDGFAAETAKLSLWLAEHQMNLSFEAVFGSARATLPLHDGGRIVCDNATALDWESVCPKDAGSEIYILGNPPYLGARNQSPIQKADLASVFDGHKDYKDSDYVCCWYLKGVQYIAGTNHEFAFVSTNSICQGEQVSYLWPRILKTAEIGFAYQSFKWTNSAKGNAGVTCVIVGIRSVSNRPKFIFNSGVATLADNISPYLHNGRNVIVFPATEPLTDLPNISMGNMPRDGGNLILSVEEANELRANYPECDSMIRAYLGADEFLNGKLRFCLWIDDDTLPLALSIPPIKSRIERVRVFREDSPAKTTNQYSATPHRFAQRSYVPGSVIIAPSVSSERRAYIPFGYLGSDSIISNAAYAIYRASPYIFGVISSHIHMVWVWTVAGRMKTDPRYSAALCFNPFPFPQGSEKLQSVVEEEVFSVLDVREQHSEKTLAQMYDPNKMPVELKNAHRRLDMAVERCFRPKPFQSDEERLNLLFERYEALASASGRGDSENAESC